MTIIEKIINDINTIFIPFYSNEALYLNEDKIDNLIKKFDNNYLNSKINDIHTIVMSIYSSYQKIDEETKKNNLSLNINICVLLNKYLFFIYATFIIFNDIKSKQQIQIFLYKTSFKNYITNILKKFNYDIFNISEKKSYYYHLDDFKNKYIEKISLNKAYILPNNIKTVIRSKYNLINYIKYYIYTINNIIYIKPNIKNNYITIPQYKNICWFIAILTGITYSDMSKNLLLINNKSRINNNYQDFNNFIFYIIDNITKNHKIYNDNIDYDYEIFKTLKRQPPKIITSLIINYTKNNEDKCIESLLTIIELAITNNFSKNFKYYRNEIIRSYYHNYFLYKFISNLPINIFTDFIKILNIKTIDDFNINKNNLKKLLKIRIHKYYNTIKISTNFGSYSRECIIISFLYEILNINSLCCQYYKNNDMIYTNYIKGDTNSPDVIILEVIKTPNNNNKRIFNIKINSNEIIFNGNKYKLDYFINSSNDKLSCNNCGHTISAITYNNKKYLYDSSGKINLFKDNIIIPCPLIKYDWNYDIFNNKYYTIKKGSYITIDPLTIYQKDNIIHNNIYYKFDSDIIYVYVKI